MGRQKHNTTQDGPRGRGSEAERQCFGIPSQEGAALVVQSHPAKGGKAS